MFGRAGNELSSALAGEPTVEPLNDAEVRWRDDHIRMAAQLAQEFAASADPLPSLAALDRCVEVCSSGSRDPATTQSFVDMIGLAFGAHVARDTGLEWVLTTDRAGRDLALHRAEGNVLIYPANSVAKRLAARETGFLLPLHASLVQTVHQISA